MNSSIEQPYGKAELELAKLKALSKGSEIVSATVPGLLIMILVSFFIAVP